MWITLSDGLARLDDDGTEAEDLLDRADARLFEAKQAGRNRFVGPPSHCRTAGQVTQTSWQE